MIKQSQRQERLSRINTFLFVALVRDHALLSRAFADDILATLEWSGQLAAEEYLALADTGIAHHPPVLVPVEEGAVAIAERPEVKLDATRLADQITAAILTPTTQRLRKDYTKNYSRIIDQTANTITNITGIGVGVSDPAQERIFHAGGKRLGMVDISGSTRTSLFRAIDEANHQGLNPRQTARLIRQEVPAGRFINAGAGYRAQLISRTETNWAQNAVSIACYRESEVVDGCIAMDGDGDPECAARDGQFFSFDEAEIEMENEHPNGTLCFAPHVTSDYSPSEADVLEDTAANLVSVGTPDTAGRTLDSLNVARLRSTERQMKSAADKVASVHNAPKKSVPIKAQASLDMKGSLRGQYWSGSRITINARLDAAQQRATTYHELGHWLDNMVHRGRANPHSVAYYRGYASDYPKGPLGDVMRAIQASERSSKAIMKDSYFSEDYKIYASSNIELFARAYAQYMAEASGDTEALRVLEVARSSYVGMLGQTQWARDDFRPIYKKIDEALQKMGLKRTGRARIPAPRPIPRTPVRAPIRPTRPTRPTRPITGARRMNSAVTVRGGMGRAPVIRGTVRQVGTIHKLPPGSTDIRVILKLPKGTPASVFGRYIPGGNIEIGQANEIITRSSVYQQLGRYTDHMLGGHATETAFASRLDTTGPMADLIARLRATSRVSGNTGFREKLMQPEELFSRGYAQYVATKLGDEGVLSAMRVSATQWGNFDELMPLFDDLFRAEGLLL